MPIERIGQDFVVNTTTADGQFRPSIAALADGRFLVTWDSDDGSGSDTSGGCIRARFYNADGSAAGSDFVVNTTTANDQYTPSATALTDGRILVTWESYDSRDIRARLYNADGSAAGDDFVVNTSTIGGQYTPSVTALSGGGFVVAWDSEDRGGSDTAGNSSIRARLYTAGGVPAGDDFVVNSTTANDQYSTSVAALPDGRFVVTWDSNDHRGSDTSGFGIRARFYNADGSAAGNDFVVNSTTADDQYFSSVTALADGRFVVTWQSDDDGGTDDSSGCIRARLYNADGSPTGNDFVVNSATASDRQNASVTALADGRFVIAWQSFDGDDSNAADMSGYGIRARLFNMDGSFAGDDFVVNSTTTNSQFQPSVAALADGRFVAAWESWDASGGDTSVTAIRAQMFDPTVFRAVAGESAWQGGNLADDITGSAADDTLSGLGGDDTLKGGGGSDTLDGGAGDDTAVYFGAFASHTIQDLGDRVTVMGPDGTDTLISIERLWFSDATVRLGAVALAAIAEDSGARVITQAELLSGWDGAPAVARDLAIASGGGTLADNQDGTWTYRPAANDDAAVSFSYVIDDGNEMMARASLDITAVNDAPSARPVTLAPIDEDSGARLITQAELLANASDVDGPALAAANLRIAAGLGVLADNHDGTWSYTPAGNDDTAVTFAYEVTDGTTPVAAEAKLFINPLPDAPPVDPGTAGDDAFDAPAGTARFNGSSGIDTMRFDFRLTDAQVSHVGNTVVIDGPSSRTILEGFERFVFADGTVDNADGDRLVDDLFYYARNHDVWNAGADADAHYHQFGWHEARDPSAFFSTSIYLSLYPDVQAANVDPLAHFGERGWSEGRAPSIAFDPAAYLAANPDVSAAGVDPLRHYLESGYQEGRVPTPFDHLLAPSGFDYVWYLQHNPDVAAAHVDPLAHFQTTGWKEGRDPNALFDTSGYLAQYPDVAAAGINPLEHYNQFGWMEGRDPSPSFDADAYLAAYPDVAGAGINPLQHFLQFGIHEGRSAFADGSWG